MSLFGKKSKKEELLWEKKVDNLIRGFCFSLDGLIFVGRSEQPGRIYLFSRSEQLLWSYGARDVVFAVSLSADGSLIAAGSFDGNISLAS